LDLGNVDLIVGLAYKLIKGNTLVELHIRYTIHHVPSIGLFIIPVVAKTFLDRWVPKCLVYNLVGLLLTFAPILQGHLQPIDLLVSLL
jgi:hypothetical protein